MLDDVKKDRPEMIGHEISEQKQVNISSWYRYFFIRFSNTSDLNLLQVINKQ